MLQVRVVQHSCEASRFLIVEGPEAMKFPTHPIPRVRDPSIRKEQNPITLRLSFVHFAFIVAPVLI